MTSFLFVLSSILGFCLETIPQIRGLAIPTSSSVTSVSPTAASEEYYNTEEETATHLTPDFLEILDYICTIFFTIELIVRVIFAPNKRKFFRSPMNIIDILALLPLYVQITLDKTEEGHSLKNHRAVIETIFILRIIRIFRIFHLVKHYKALKILVHAIKASIHELLMLSIFLFIAMLVFSTLIFYAERADIESMEPGDFDAIPKGFYWSIITMTTVGYGDLYPHTALGCVIGAMCALSGVLLVALTIPVISNNFALFYMHARTREQITSKDYVDILQNSCVEEEEEPATPDLKCKHNNVVSDDKPGSGSDVTRAGLESHALLMHADSHSHTDECGITLINSTVPDDSPRKHANNNTLETTM